MANATKDRLNDETAKYADTDSVEAPKFQITRHRTDDRPGKYDAEVRALIEADKELTEEDIAEGIFNSLTILIPAPAEKEKDGETVLIDQAPKYKRYVQESAKAHGKTAREVNSVENGDGTVSFEFRLTDQVKRPRKKNAEVTEISDAA